MSGPKGIRLLAAPWHRVHAALTERHPWHDPTTGDDLTPSEHASLVAQNIIRRWIALWIVTGITIICWSLGTAVATGWNLGASYYTIVLEQIIGIGMFGMARRDQVILRLNRKTAAHTESLLEAMALADEKRDAANLQRDAADEKRDQMMAHLAALLQGQGRANAERQQILDRLGIEMPPPPVDPSATEKETSNG